MSKPITTTEEYRAELHKLGELVYARKPLADLRERYAAFLAEEQAAEGVFPAFGILCEALGLDEPAALCVALWMYLETSPHPALTIEELLAHGRRLGSPSPRPDLAGIFIANGDKAALHPLITDFLLEREPRLPEGLALIIPAEAELLHTKALYHEILALLNAYTAREDAFPLVIALCGEKGSGRTFLLSQLCREMGAALLKVDGKADPNLDDILLAAKLYGAVLCVENPQNPEQLAAIAAQTGVLFILCAGEEAPPPSGDYTLFRRELPEPDSSSRKKILLATLGNALPEIDTAMENALHRLNIGQTEQLARRLLAESMAAGTPIDKELFLRLLREQSPPPLAGMTRMDYPGSLSDLILPPALSRQLTELCAFVKRWDTVYKSWGFAEKVPWGRGISALFYGAPGTGKTMAAAVLANETGLPLLRVDISQLISKYIGETQKNIGKIFEQAAKTKGILFFDEADAIFAKRTESADAQDKYANAETAYLLQRMEQHDGVCILATNLLQNFDEAFRRRIGYMLHFPLPDAALREKIWRGIFPASAPTEDIDYALLAEGLELSGASIKNCAVHGAFLAATNGTAITMSYILDGAKNEYQKQGKTISPQLMQALSM
jgi:cytidylate kinase